jgi:hypothetical protein
VPRGAARSSAAGGHLGVAVGRVAVDRQAEHRGEKRAHFGVLIVGRGDDAEMVHDNGLGYRWLSL